MEGKKEVKRTTSFRLPEKKFRMFKSIIALKNDRFSEVIEGLVDGYIQDNSEFYAEKMSQFVKKQPDVDGEQGQPEENAAV